MARARSKSKEPRAAVDETQEEERHEDKSAANQETTGDSWLERLRPITAQLGSLELAIVLLSVWAAALLLGTFVESWYDATAAGELVYATWWFRVLLGVLAANILCAALKKWPWKKHQLGFLITHVGLLTLVAAGAWSVLASTSGVITLDNAKQAGPNAQPKMTNIVTNPRRHSLRVLRTDRPPEMAEIVSFKPGVLGWTVTGVPMPPPDDSAAPWLQKLATPLAAPPTYHFDDGETLTVLAYYPHAITEPFSPAPPSESGAPAVAFQISSPGLGTLPLDWLMDADELRGFDVGPARVEISPTASPAEIQAWLKPTAAPHCESTRRGLLQFALDTNGQLWYRTFHRPNETDLELTFERSGPIGPRDPAVEIWDRMQFRLKVAKVLPRARYEDICEPIARPLGVADEEHPPAVYCRLEANGKRSEHWLPRSNETGTHFQLDGKTYLVGFHPESFLLDFGLSLRQAKQRLDAGTSLAEQTSTVELTDPGAGLDHDPRTIELNAPLEYRGYKFYQSTLRTLGRDADGRPVTQVQLTVGYDPASYLKYAGAAIVSLGIACMFYMRAYALTSIDLWTNPDSGTTAD